MCTRQITSRLVFQRALLLVFSALSTTCLAQKATVAWDASSSPDVVDYRVYYRESGSSILSYLDVGNVTTATITGLTTGKTYSVYVTSRTSIGVQSPASNVITFTVGNGKRLLASGIMGSGSVSAVSADPSGTTGTTLQFNGGNSTPDGVASLVYSTMRGQQYALVFDLGAYSMVNQNQQQMAVTAQGTDLLASEMLSIFAPGNGMRWANVMIVFYADGDYTTVTFQDASDTSANVDMYLRNIVLIDPSR